MTVTRILGIIALGLFVAALALKLPLLVPIGGVIVSVGLIVCPR